MGKRVTGFEIDDDGRMHQYSGKQTRGLRKSERAGEIPWTRGPDTKWRKFVRNAVG